MTNGIFSKPPLTLSGQIALLKSRGMQVDDDLAAENVLLRLNYYRFSGYALHFEIFQDGQRTHNFKPGTLFDDVVNLYEFDTRLRALLFCYIEPVEVAFRAVLCYELSLLTGDPHWYLDPGMYDERFDLGRLWDDCETEYQRRSDEVFIESYRSKYSFPPLPPAWMMSEILSIGRWSKVFQHLADQNARKAVARQFNTKPYYLQSWIHALSVLRNLCAHHSRIWNRNFTISPALPSPIKARVLSNTKLAVFVAVLESLLTPLGKEIEFQRGWNALLTEFPLVPLDKMGFSQSQF
ncbi:MAG: Abi family protein [Candidatus Hydrogenedentes bacterium]|nr:Abi family protein [Candidatus Hydrogenedentota bacterium]